MFSHARTLFTVFGFELRVDPSWLLIALLVTWSLHTQIFPEALPGQSPAVYLAMAVAGMLLLFGCLLLHEMAHALVARRFGLETPSITLFLFGGVAELAEEPRRPDQELWIALAGPAMSFLLAALCWSLAQAAPLPATAREVLGYLALLNLILAVFNLLPAFPLDGGRVLRAWLWQRGGDVLAATETAARAGQVLAYALMVLGGVALFQGAVVGGLWQIVLALFLLAAARSSVEAGRLKYLLGNSRAGDLMTSAPVVAAPDMTLSELVTRVMLPNRVSFVPVMEGDVLLGHISSSVLAGMDRENWSSAQVGDVFVALSDSDVIAPDLPIPELFKRVAETGHRKFMVVSGRRLVGIITLADLTRYLALMSDVAPLARGVRAAPR